MKKTLFLVLNILIVGCSSSSKIEDQKINFDKSVVLSKEILQNSQNSDLSIVGENISKTIKLTEIEKVIQSILALFPKFDISTMTKFIATSLQNHYYLYMSPENNAYILMKFWINKTDNTKVDLGNMTQGILIKRQGADFIIKDSTAKETISLKNGYDKIYMFVTSKGYYYSSTGWNQTFSENLIKTMYYIVNDQDPNQLKLIQTKVSNIENNKILLKLYNGDINDSNAYFIDLKK